MNRRYFLRSIAAILSGAVAAKSFGSETETLSSVLRKRLPLIVFDRHTEEAASRIIAKHLLRKAEDGHRVAVVASSLMMAKKFAKIVWDERACVTKNVDRRRDIDRVEMKIGNHFDPIGTISFMGIGDGTRMRGRRATVLFAFYAGSIPKDILEEVCLGFTIDSKSQGQIIVAGERIGVMPKYIERHEHIVKYGAFPGIDLVLEREDYGIVELKT